MAKQLEKFLKGYKVFREKYAADDQSVMHYLSKNGQKPEAMVIACCDSRVDPALILQCDPGDLFVVRNVANIVPPYEKDEAHHGTSAALEFGLCFLNIKHLILLGHSQCGGMQSLFDNDFSHKNDFITPWMSLVKMDQPNLALEAYTKLALQRSYENCLTFPWIKDKITQKDLTIYQWFFDIEKGQVSTYSFIHGTYEPLETLVSSPFVMTGNSLKSS